MKPPSWTGASSGIDLREPPICNQCIGDWDKADKTGEEPKRSPDGNNGILAQQEEVLKSTASEVLHQMRRMNRIEESTGSVNEDQSISKKRSRLEDKCNSKANTIDLKVPKKAKLEDPTTKSRAACIPLLCSADAENLEQRITSLHQRMFPCSSLLTLNSHSKQTSRVHFRNGCRSFLPIRLRSHYSGGLPYQFSFLLRSRLWVISSLPISLKPEVRILNLRVSDLR